MSEVDSSMEVGKIVANGLVGRLEVGKIVANGLVGRPVNGPVGRTEVVHPPGGA